MNEKISDHSATLALHELQDALLNRSTVNDLLRDIELCTEIIEILPKFATEAYVVPASVSLADAREMISQSAVRALQLRYRYEGAEWWDTLMVLPNGFRLVRIRHDVSELTEGSTESVTGPGAH